MLITTEKTQLRKKIRQSFAADLKPRAHAEAARKICRNMEKLISLVLSANQPKLLAFWPSLPEEPDFQQVLKAGLGHGHGIGLPEMVWSPRKLIFRRIEKLETDLVTDARGIVGPHPRLPEFPHDEAGLVIVPGLAFDRNGHRLGRGAGFYDRFLESVNPAVPRWAPAFDCQVIDHVPVDTHDQKVFGLILPDGLWDCRSGSWLAKATSSGG